MLDSRGLGTVAQIPLPGEPDSMGQYQIAVDASRGYVYVTDAHRGTVIVLRDVSLPPPPSPTPTDTPTPYPLPSAAARVAPELSCQHVPGAPFELRWASDALLRSRLGCAVDKMQSGFLAEQPFERGHMLWREADQAVLVLLNDGTWHSYPDQWHEGMQEHSCEGSPPDSLLQPKRGFGLVWCEQNGVKERLGWAIDEEGGDISAWQVFEHGLMISSATRAVTYALFEDGTFTEYPAA